MLPEPQQNISQIDDEEENLRAKLSESERKNSQLEKEHEQLQSKLSESERKNSQLEKEHEQLQSKLSESERKNSQLEKEHEQLQSKLSESERKNSQLEKEHEQLQSKLSESERKNSQLEKEHEQLQSKLSESERKNSQLENEKATHLSTIQSLQREKEQIQREIERIRGESDKRLIEMKQTTEGMRDQLDMSAGRIGASKCIVAFRRERYKVNGSTVTRVSSVGRAGCFTQSVSKGIHRLSIKNEPLDIMIGVLDAAEHQRFFTSGASTSPKGAMMHNMDGYLYTAEKKPGQNRVGLDSDPKKSRRRSADRSRRRSLGLQADLSLSLHHIMFFGF
ncbi:hypothetical protein BLNAU_20838 [Blattamonas nauphoetae]|uniref:Uncharacterized protein n=1 Tax=Blattamonas nauphoetae TaxID=2049346 RepID=A0ABQ9WXI9_9EUKA|nr:hypothetical protein BLNAU_20838 [Blattamonas nauphoetae]